MFVTGPSAYINTMEINCSLFFPRLEIQKALSCGAEIFISLVS